MVTHLIDSDICVHFLGGRAPAVRRKFLAVDRGRLAISAVAAAELWYGVWASTRVAENLAALEEFVKTIAILPFDRGCAVEYGKVRAHLRRQGISVGPNDLLIASTALAHDLTLVTANTREFGRIPGLRLDDWTGEGGGAPNPVQP